MVLLKVETYGLREDIHECAPLCMQAAPSKHRNRIVAEGLPSSNGSPVLLPVEMPVEMARPCQCHDIAQVVLVGELYLPTRRNVNPGRLYESIRQKVLRDIRESYQRALCPCKRWTAA